MSPASWSRPTGEAGVRRSRAFERIVACFRYCEPERKIQVPAYLRPEEKMSSPLPTFAGWYPDADTGGTKYWDGKHWTGDTRPRRKPFAAASRPDNWPLYWLGLSFPALPLTAFAFPDESVEEPVVWLLVGIVMLLVYVAVGFYLFRGQGPSTQAVEARLAAHRKDVKSKWRRANIASVAATLGRRGQPYQSRGAVGDDAAAAQIDAIARPGTAEALQRLHNLLFTRAITDAEYESAKSKLFGGQPLDDSFAQIAKLAELHEAGVLGDVEFSAAKARALGL